MSAYRETSCRETPHAHRHSAAPVHPAGSGIDPGRPRSRPPARAARRSVPSLQRQESRRCRHLHHPARRENERQMQNDAGPDGGRARPSAPAAGRKGPAPAAIGAARKKNGAACPDRAVLMRSFGQHALPQPVQLGVGERLDAFVDVADAHRSLGVGVGRLAGVVAGEAVVQLVAQGDIGFHRRIGQRVAADVIGLVVAAGSLERVVRIIAAIGPGGADQQIVAPGIALFQQAADAVVDRNHLAVGLRRALRRLYRQSGGHPPGEGAQGVAGRNGLSAAGPDRERTGIGIDIHVLDVERPGRAIGREQHALGHFLRHRHRRALGVDVGIGAIGRVAVMLERGPDHFRVPGGAADHMQAHQRQQRLAAAGLHPFLRIAGIEHRNLAHGGDIAIGIQAVRLHPGGFQFQRQRVGIRHPVMVLLGPGQHLVQLGLSGGEAQPGILGAAGRGKEGVHVVDQDGVVDHLAAPPHQRGAVGLLGAAAVGLGDPAILVHRIGLVEARLVHPDAEQRCRLAAAGVHAQLAIDQAARLAVVAVQHAVERHRVHHRAVAAEQAHRRGGQPQEHPLRPLVEIAIDGLVAGRRIDGVVVELDAVGRRDHAVGRHPVEQEPALEYGRAHRTGGRGVRRNQVLRLAGAAGQAGQQDRGCRRRAGDSFADEHSAYLPVSIRASGKAAGHGKGAHSSLQP
ncbi:conserved hypothetical protein [Chromobacterium violaceum ATCC 12472]|uniref:Uncharacterized protein n=1 Tax=Chromobacterium violaceum (strain ATCC 12472 / DSM 30191 / JCM 1249 / CCUG 213 / NBRC 12614 / NCIMB 9131 / NCTC 9757 / MK) TaxID=243365 RepID=Q7NSM9_CHRVO|nr:conserved hypothetical protein [Chromobacterium violaceum ATCC 12472]